ncbi:MAG: Holliday junction resolvase RuvX, partial [Christensenellales bacterium]
MGLDIGEKRIGIACSDALLLTAQGLESYQRKGLEADLAHIAALLEEKQARELVLGMPRNMNGSYGPAAEKVRAFAQALEARVDVPIV